MQLVSNPVVENCSGEQFLRGTQTLTFLQCKPAFASEPSYSLDHPPYTARTPDGDYVFGLCAVVCACVLLHHNGRLSMP